MITRKPHKHDWRNYVTTESDFECHICWRRGKELKRYNPKTGHDEYRIVMNTRR